MWLDDSDEEMEMIMAHVMGLAERYAGPAQPAAACSTGENNGSTAQQTQQTDQGTLSTEERSEQAVESVTTETEPSASQNGATMSMPSQSSGSSLSQLTPSTSAAEDKQLQIVEDISASLSNQMAVTTDALSISSQLIDASESTNSQSTDASKSLGSQLTDGSKSTSSCLVIVTNISKTGDSLPSVSSVTLSDITDAVTKTESQISTPLVTVRDVAGFKSDSQSSGSSSKRKSSEGEDAAAGQVEAGMVEGEPSRKELRKEEGGEPGEQQGEGGHPEEEDREDVEELVKMFNRHRRRPLSPNREQHFRRLPREIVHEIRNEMVYQDMYRRLGRHRSRKQGRRERLSDEDSDEETLRQNAWSQEQAKFPVTMHQKLLRLLILGGVTRARGRAQDPTTNSDFSVISDMIASGEGPQVVDILKDVSVRGRSSKQDGLVYALALCCRSEDMDTKRAAYAAVQDMIRTPTQIFQLINYIEKAGSTTGWGRGLRRALCTWYNNYSTNPMRLAMHVTKYWSRHGWNHQDVFRLSHIKPMDNVIGFIIRYIAKDMQEAEKFYLEDGYLGNEQLEKVHKYLKAVEEAKRMMDVERTVELIQEYGLVREQLRTEMLNEPAIWDIMLPDMPLTALMRNLGKMSVIGLFNDAERVQIVVSKLSNVTAMKKARIHPFKLLLAHHIYGQGKGDKGKLVWAPNGEILTALENAFYQSFEAVEPSNKRILIALDISASMCSKMFDSPIEVREAATLMAMVTFRREPHCDIVGFHHKLVPLEMFKDPNKNLRQLVWETHHMGFGATDCAKPMIWARKHRKEYDAFIIYTDSETNMHRVPPHAALDKYREVMNIPTAKLVVVGMTAQHFSIARPDDLHMLDVVGFDPDTPEMIREFLVGGLE